MTPTASSGSISVERAHGGSYRLTSIFALPQPIDLLFSFFSDAHNLEKLTPPSLEFHVLTPAPIPIDPYRRWYHDHTVCQNGEGTLVGDCVELRGPYRRWDHEHTFSENGEGTLVGDCVDFEVPGGRLPERLASSDLRRIFAYRRTRLNELFG